MVSFLCCKAAPDEDAPSTPKKKKSAVAPRQPSPEEPEETVVETKEEPEEAMMALGNYLARDGRGRTFHRRRVAADAAAPVAFLNRRTNGDHGLRVRRGLDPIGGV